MKLKLLSITALLIAVGLATPVRADEVRQTNEQQTVQRRSDRDYNWQWDRRDRRRDDGDRSVEVETERDRGDWSRRNRRDDRYNDFHNDIDEIYQEVLGRSVDNKGLRTYSKRLEKGDSLREIRTDIAQSDEATDVVKSIYRDITGRNASRSTIKDYTRRLAAGWTLNDVEDDISDSE